MNQTSGHQLGQRLEKFGKSWEAINVGIVICKKGTRVGGKGIRGGEKEKTCLVLEWQSGHADISFRCALFQKARRGDGIARDDRHRRGQS